MRARMRIPQADLSTCGPAESASRPERSGSGKGVKEFGNEYCVPD
jgi:hypothetical protein